MMRNPWAGRMVRVAGLVFGLAWSGFSGGGEIPRPEHPRPDFRREAWLNLNGVWQFRFDPEDRGLEEQWQTASRFEDRIAVPFGWQSRLSGVGDTTGQTIGWYRRTVRVPQAFEGKRLWLRLGAVDWEARVWVNGREAGHHEGGYTPFSFDVTSLVGPDREAAIVVRALDATDPELPLGKQVSGWYTPTSGIWQTVWLEARPACYLNTLRLTPYLRGRQWLLRAELEAAGPDGRLAVEMASPQSSVQEYRGSLDLQGGRGRLLASLDVNSPKLWTPESPFLYDLTIRLTDAGGAVDTVHTYFGLRTIARGTFGDLPHEVILLNDEPVYLRGALDQSFNPKGVYTAPSDEFMRRDMEIAKRAGFNFLRIHVKSEEPRRLYWADRLGLLVMEDMPCTFVQSPRARQAWEETMRATIERDRNHPSVIAWCLFNESWGLGGRRFREDRDTQRWVLRQWEEAKNVLDPSRLVEDNSPCLYDHVQTDLNSWHFYFDDYARARDHIEQVVAATRPGSAFNYVPGRQQGTEPLINSEYGAVSARGGDRDVSWGFRYLTTQLRRHELITGYVYTELTDVEWEHNGVVDYDRSAKDFGYEAFVPDMTLADLQGADFVGFDAPPAIEAALGEEFTLPLFVSHFSTRSEAPSLRWQIVGVDDVGQPVSTPPRTERVTWQRCRVRFQKPLHVHVPSGRSFVGALSFELLDERDERIAANFVNLIVRPPPPGLETDQQPSKHSPRVEVLAPRLVAIRFDPDDFASYRADEMQWDWLNREGKFCAVGTSEVEYRLKLPAFVRHAIPSQVVLMAELATKADAQRLDWPSVRQLSDYPQTQSHKHPGTVKVRLLDRTLWEFELPDDPADARGVLSHQALYHGGSYGYLVRRKADLTKYVTLREALLGESTISLVFSTASEGCGLSLYGRQLGRYPIDPTIIIQTARDLSQPVGWTSDDKVTVARLLDRSRTVNGVETGDNGGHDWRLTTEKPAADWTTPAFDDSSWETGTGGFGHDAPPWLYVRTAWKTRDLWLRTEVQLASPPLAMLLRYGHEGDSEVYVNGRLLLQATGGSPDYQHRPLSKNEVGLFAVGRNTIAVHCRRTGDRQGIDLGLRWLEVEPEMAEKGAP
ncbi:MAG: hypothetical protein JXB62_19565 [Pirellulales bacterium]|nr:hypothetical protein [Pirellulales bacterium]